MGVEEPFYLVLVYKGPEYRPRRTPLLFWGLLLVPLALSGHINYGIMKQQSWRLTFDASLGCREMYPGCISLRSDIRPEDFIPVPNSSQGILGYELAVCATLQGHASPDHHCPTAKPVVPDDVTGSITFTTASPDCHTCHMISVWPCSHLWREWGANGWPANSGIH